MPVYNCEAYVGLAIESILSQTYKALKLIVVDDASTDNTPAILAQYESDGVRVLRHEQNLGVTRARNAGIAVAEGDYIAAMDADDISMPERIARQVEYLENHPQLLAVGCWEKVIDPEGAQTGVRHPPVEPWELSELFAQGTSLEGATLMIRASALRALGGYRMWVAEDYDLLLRLTDNSPNVGMVAEELYLVRRRHPSICSTQWDMVALCMWVALESAKARRAGRPDFLEDLSPEETREFCCQVREGKG
jgi:glycosyltransferase involved in cell wall biosynthesis